ncbi:MAG: hypothetical protein HYS12_14040 [Planctomycetes bacterium]|nr:hypothetical protein [Planctomycetota bacterium]
MRISQIARCLYRMKWYVFCVLGVATLAGEVYLRLPCGRQLEYQPDPDLGGVFRPGQSSSMVTVNRDGHRGKDTDWLRPVLLAVGDSQSWGSGVPDADVWTARLEDFLHEKPDLGAIQVVNASHPGHGPYHQFVRMRRVLEAHKVRAVLVRVSIEDRRFTAPRPEELPRLVAEVEWRQQVRSVTKFLPFVVNKAKEQLPSMAAVFGPKQMQTTAVRSEEAGRKMWEEQSRWWERMIEVAAEHNTSLVFCIHDPTDLPSSAVLAANLAKQIEGRKNVFLLRLGSKAYGLRAGNTDALWREYRSRFTLFHDDHGNQAQHELVARTLFAFFQDKGFFPAGQPSYRPQ